MIGVCDFNNKVIKKFKKKYPKIKIFDKAKTLIKDKNIKLVTIASYDNFHFEHIKECINEGKDFFVEKPLCLHFREYKNIKKLLKQKKTH